MSRQQHLQSSMFLTHMSRAIGACYAEGVELLLQYEAPRTTPAMLTPFVQMAFNMPSFAEATDFRIQGHRLDKDLMPKDETAYEGSLRWIIAALCAHGASPRQPDREGRTLAQRAFADLSPNMLARSPARLEVVAQTLYETPSWVPDLSTPFKRLDCLPADPDATQKRQQLAEHMGGLGCEIGQWLKHWCPTGQVRDTTKTTYAPFMDAMPAASRDFWLRDNWKLDAAQMPWGDEAKIRAQRTAALQADFNQLSPEAQAQQTALAAISRASHAQLKNS